MVNICVNHTSNRIQMTIKDNKEYIPNGGMCLSCTKLHDNCSNMAFDTMRAIKKYKDNVIMVLCVNRVQSMRNQYNAYSIS